MAINTSLTKLLRRTAGGFSKSNRWRFGKERISVLQAALGKASGMTPRAVARRLSSVIWLVRVSAVFLALLVLVWIISLCMDWRWLSSVIARYGLLILGSVIVVSSSGMLFGIRIICGKLKCVVEEYNYQVCVECGYPLIGLPDNHLCPECGELYSFTALRHDWKRWLSRQIVYNS